MTSTKEDTEFQQSILAGLNNLHKHVYAGTVTAKEKLKRRAKNKAQKKSRKANRG